MFNIKHVLLEQLQVTKSATLELERPRIQSQRPKALRQPSRPNRGQVLVSQCQAVPPTDGVRRVGLGIHQMSHDPSEDFRARSGLSASFRLAGSVLNSLLGFSKLKPLYKGFMAYVDPCSLGPLS